MLNKQIGLALNEIGFVSDVSKMISNSALVQRDLKLQKLLQSELTIHIFFATHSKKAVILKIVNKPKVMAWNIENDSFKPGQWMKGQKLDVQRCSISPNGKYFLYHSVKNNQTCISNIPFFPN